MRPAETSRGEWKRSHRRMSRVSLLLLFLEAPVLLALIVLLDPTAETVESMTASLDLSSPFDVILGAISGALPTYADIALWGTLMWLGVCALGFAVMRYGSGATGAVGRGRPVVLSPARPCAVCRSPPAAAAPPAPESRARPCRAPRAGPGR